MIETQLKPMNNHHSAPPEYCDSSRDSIIPLKQRFCCTVIGCGKDFSTSGHLFRHTKIHSKIKEHSCPILGCSMAFSRKDNMQQHFICHERKIRNLRENVVLKPAIGASFIPTQTSLKWHMDTTEKDKKTRVRKSIGNLKAPERLRASTTPADFIAPATSGTLESTWDYNVIRPGSAGPSTMTSAFDPFASSSTSTSIHDRYPQPTYPVSSIDEYSRVPFTFFDGPQNGYVDRGFERGRDQNGRENKMFAGTGDFYEEGSQRFGPLDVSFEQMYSQIHQSPFVDRQFSNILETAPTFAPLYPYQPYFSQAQSNYFFTE